VEADVDKGKRNLTAQSNKNLSFGALFFRISPVDHYDLQVKKRKLTLPELMRKMG